jgi:hypothetical protein
MDPMMMGSRRMEKSKGLRLLYYLRIYGTNHYLDLFHHTGVFKAKGSLTKQRCSWNR